MFEAIRLEGLYQMVCACRRKGRYTRSRKQFLYPDLLLTEGLFA